MRNIHKFVVLLLFVAGLVHSERCRKWCRKKMSFDYHCCDGRKNEKNNTTDGITTASSEQTKITKPVSVPTTTIPLSVSSCRYFCAYNDRIYCCDDGSNPIPGDHDLHDGRCPRNKEQICKSDGMYLNGHAIKVKNKFGTNVLAEIGADNEYQSCASDGYCGEEEKCCPNKCVKQHTCMYSLYDYDGGYKLNPSKKKYRKNI